MLANNLANADTGGYKADREFYGLYASAEAEAGADTEGALPTTSPWIRRPWTDFSQGVMRATSNQTDFGLSGKGFFSVAGPDGPLYTRDGAFRISPAGTLQTQDGYNVSVNGGKPLQLDATAAFQVNGDGTVLQSGQPVGRLDIVDFDDRSALAKRGDNYFVNSGAAPKPSADTQVLQGKLETSNVGPAEGAVRLVSVLRQFETLQKAISIGADMNRRAVEEVAKV
jgi:flagellar basal body rod protein FlgG